MAAEKEYRGHRTVPTLRKKGTQPSLDKMCAVPSHSNFKHIPYPFPIIFLGKLKIKNGIQNYHVLKAPFYYFYDFLPGKHGMSRMIY